MLVTHCIVFLMTLQAIQGEDTKCNETVDITDGTADGTNIIKDGLTFTENDYYIDSDQLIWGCICRVKKCIRRCCASDESLQLQSNDSMDCSVAGSSVNTTQELESVVGLSISLFHIISVPAREVCVETDEVKVYLEDSFEVDSSGNLTWNNEQFGFQDYCATQYNGGSVVVVCVVPDASINALVYCLGMIISMPFLFITFLVYLLLPDRNLHQKALMFYVLALLFSYILLVTINLSNNFENPLCSIFGYTTVFTFMVSFFWMNVICFDIWYTFSGGRGFAGSKKTSERKRLTVYGIYAFGMPLLLLVLIYLLDEYLPENSKHRPRIGNPKCFLSDGWPNLWYFYAEAGILVLANIIFFVLTALRIRKVKQETSMLKHSDSKRHSYEKDKQNRVPFSFWFNLYVKLLFAMGVNWSMEVISWLVNWQVETDVQYIFYITDFFNAVYGVWIFFIFVFKRKIWMLLKKRFNSTHSQETVHTGSSSVPSASVSNIKAASP